jgi:alkanesulfonate monooxygenase SsuD/methylene tetrahydromethanopterin reductase-like flavin-dependent oxidoreductase (luciferase family)
MAPIQIGVQFHLHYWNLSIPELVKLGQMAKAGGVEQLWVTDNLERRNSFVVLAALAANIPINLGTALTVQYFRNPVDAADSIAAIGEMMDGTELSIGLGRGNPSTPNLLHAPKPVSMLRETAQSLHGLLAGEAVSFRDYPTLASYFNFNPAKSFRLNFDSKTPTRLYCGGNRPLALAVAGEFMDGLIFGGEFKAVAATGRLPSLLQIFDEAARNAGKEESLPKVAQVKLSVSRDKNAAREFARVNAGRRILGMRRVGFTPEDIMRLGVAPEEVDRLEIANRDGASPQQFGRLVSDAMLDAIFVAGDPAHCRERMLEVRETAHEHGFQQLKFSELGPDPKESIRLLCEEIIPAL